MTSTLYPPRLRLDINGQPHRTVRLTLFRGIDRIEIENAVAGRPEAELSYSFDFALDNPEIHFEEVGAIARPGLSGRNSSCLKGCSTLGAMTRPA